MSTTNTRAKHRVQRAFGRSLRRARIAAGMTLPELATKAHLSKGLLSDIENGKGNPCLDTLHKLGWALNFVFTIPLRP